MSTTAYANEEIDFTTVLLDNEGTPRCRLPEGVRINSQYKDVFDEIPESHFGDMDTDIEELSICRLLDALDISIEDEDIVLGMVPMPTAFVNTFITSIILRSGILVGVNTIVGCAIISDEDSSHNWFAVFSVSSGATMGYLHIAKIGISLLNKIFIVSGIYLPISIMSTGIAEALCD